MVDVYSPEGVVVEQRELASDIFGVPVKEGVVHLAVTAQNANARPMVAHTKTRGEVRGGGKKPWKQKGTGRARHGSIRSPIWRGGGIVFGPRTDRNYTLKINKKVRRKAICMALSQKVTDGSLILLSTLAFEKPATKTAAALLKRLPLTMRTKRTARVALVSPLGAGLVNKSFRNIPSVTIVPAHSLNVVDLLKAHFVVMPLSSVSEIEKNFAGIKERGTGTEERGTSNE
ncbi:50S ribosomal protein L4 [Candidatus Uhrbacteria bacterium]|nr:50S ribosomal protein L4 [Candidatus Uhrbacteria bacterium]